MTDYADTRAREISRDGWTWGHKTTIHPDGRGRRGRKRADREGAGGGLLCVRVYGVCTLYRTQDPI